MILFISNNTAVPSAASSSAAARSESEEKEDSDDEKFKVSESWTFWRGEPLHVSPDIENDDAAWERFKELVADYISQSQVEIYGQATNYAVDEMLSEGWKKKEDDSEEEKEEEEEPLESGLYLAEKESEEQPAEETIYQEVQMNRASAAGETITLRASSFPFGDHVLKMRSWYGTLRMENITPEFMCMAQTVDALKHSSQVGKCFWGWKMLMFNCWKLIVFIF